MTTIKQRLDFITELRENYDNSERLRITSQRAPEQVVDLLRDIHQDLIAVRNFQLGHKVELCSDCNQQLNEHNRINYAVVNNQVVVDRDDKICERCYSTRIDHLKNSTAGIP